MTLLYTPGTGIKFQFLYFISIFVLTGLFSCREESKKFQANWIIIKLISNDVDITNEVSAGNCLVNFDEKTIDLPSLRGYTFEEQTKEYEFTYERKGGKSFLSIDGYGLFKDTFTIECMDEPCCKMKLFNDATYMEFVYNSDLNMLRGRRECPNAATKLE